MADDDDGNGKSKFWLPIWVLIGSVGINQGIQTTTPSRYDPFTGADARKMRVEIMEYVDFQLAKHHIEIPPEPTRQRIRAIERLLEKVHPEFSPPSQQWYEYRSIKER